MLTPLPIDDEVSSLSAILLNDDYYDFLRTGAEIVDSIPVLSAAHLHHSSSAVGVLLLLAPFAHEGGAQRLACEAMQTAGVDLSVFN